MRAGLDALGRDLEDMVPKTGRRRVRLLRDVAKVFCSNAVEVRFRAKMERHFEWYADGVKLPPEAFRSEGRYPTGQPGAKDVQVFVSKAFQCRIYGVMRTVEAVDTFIGLEINPRKKQDKVSGAFLRAVARKAVPYLDD